MNPPELEVIGGLAFQEPIVINGKLLYRSEEVRELNTIEKYWEYFFYGKWDKQRNLLPPCTCKVRVYVDFETKMINGKETFVVSKYLKGVMINLKTGLEEEITLIKLKS